MIAFTRRTLLQLLALLPLTGTRFACPAHSTARSETTDISGYGSGAYGSSPYGGTPVDIPAKNEIFLPLIANDPT